MIVDAREPLVSEGDAAETFVIVLTGWACQFKLLPRGLRQIAGFMVAGDFVPVSPAAQVHRSGVASLTQCEIAQAPWREVAALIAARPGLALLFNAAALVETAMLQEWLAGLGRRSAEQRLAHLFCELLVRLEQVGQGGATRYPLPLTQATLGDALGLSAAHVNRSLQALRMRDLVFVEHGIVEISDPLRLKRFAGFNPNYLALTLSD